MPPRALLVLFGRLGIAQCPFRGVEPLDLAALKQPGFLYAEKPYADSKRLRRLSAQLCYIATLLLCHFYCRLHSSSQCFYGKKYLQAILSKLLHRQELRRQKMNPCASETVGSYHATSCKKALAHAD